MQEPPELTERLRVAAGCVVVFLGLFHITGIAGTLSQRLRTEPVPPAIVQDFGIIFGIIELFHVLLVVVAIVVLFIIPWVKTWDLGNLTSAVAVYGTLLWVS